MNDVAGDQGEPPGGPAPVARRVLRRLQSARLAEGTMLALAGVTGTVTGLFAAAMIALVRLVEEVSFGTEVSSVEKLLVPALGAVAVWAVSRGGGQILGSGIVTTMESLVLRGGRLSSRLPVLQVIASAAALGTGASGGRESPIVLVGGSLGSTVGRWFALGEDEVRSLVAAGAAAGIGAAFNAPIGGMLFAIEVIVGGLRSRSLQVIVVSSVAGSVVARNLIGEGLIYAPTTPYGLDDPRELILYLVVGLVCAGVAGVLALGMRVTGRVFARVRSAGGELTALVVGAIVVGLVALVVPEAFSDGEELPRINGIVEPIQALIDGDYAARSGAVGTGAVVVLVVLFAAKLVASLATFGSRTAAGTFAPTLFLGATAGATVATVAALALPDAGIRTGAYALVGMAAAYGASARAPLTAILIVFELSGDYELVLPLMLAVGIATFVVDRSTEASVYEQPLRDRGIVYAQPDDVDLLQTVHVSEVMTTGHPTVRPTLHFQALERQFSVERTHGFAVVDEGRLRGVVTIADLARGRLLLADGIRPSDTVTVADLMTTDVVTCRPTDEVFKALRLMASIDVGRVPVVSAAGTYLGMLRRGDLVDAYRTALGRGADKQHEADLEARLRDLTGVRFLELTVAAGSEADGAIIADLPWPTSAIVTSVRRGPDIHVPKGALELVAGDDVVLLSTHADAEDARSLFASDDDGAIRP